MAGVWEKQHTALYTKQKTQKYKKWQDGSLQVRRLGGRYLFTVMDVEGSVIAQESRGEVNPPTETCAVGSPVIGTVGSVQ